MKRFILLFLFFFALILRSINFSQTLNFANDQGEFLIESAKILHGEPIKLIGIYVASKPVEDKYFFIGSQFLYFLAFLQTLLNYDPLKITYAFAVINSAAVVGTYLLAKKWYGHTVALVSALLYATNPFAINYSKIIWNPTVQPILVLLLFSFLNMPFFAGIILGILICTEYSSLVLLPILLYTCRKKIFWLIAGIILGSANLVIFDLRHNFYNSTLMLKYLLHPTGTGLAPHHILTVLPLLFIFGSYFLIKFLPKKLVYFLIAGAIIFQLKTFSNTVFNQTEGFKMAKFLTYPDMERISTMIKNDNPQKYNIAQIINGETRANALRYLLTYPQFPGTLPNKYDEYNKSDWLYVVHYNSQNPAIGDTYELLSFSKERKIVWTKQVNQEISLTKLSKN